MLRRETFPEVGRPTHAVQAGKTMTVAGVLSPDEPASLGFPARSPGIDRVATYDIRTKQCLHAFSSAHPVNAMAAHSGGDVVVIGTGDYDGGYSWRGALLLLDLGSGEVTSLLSQARHVLEVDWVEGDSLAAALMPTTEDSEPFVVEHIRLDSTTWRGARAGSVDPSGLVVSTSPCELD